MGPRAKALLATISQYDDFYGILVDVLAEAEQQGYLRANDCDHSECIEKIEKLSDALRAIDDRQIAWCEACGYAHGIDDFDCINREDK